MVGASTEQQANNNGKRTKAPKRKWTDNEDEVLVATLMQLCDTGWKRSNNSFRSGYTSVLEKELSSKLPGHELKANPHIESRLKILKKHCDAITDMRVAGVSFWNNENRSIRCEDDRIWEDWVKDHPDAKSLRNKRFPHYDDLYSIYGKSRGNQKGNGADKVLEVEEESNSPGQLIRGNACKGIEIANGKVVRTESGGRKIVCEKIDNNARALLVANGSNGGYKGRLVEVEMGLQELEKGRNLEEDVIYGFDDVELSSDDAEGSQMNIEDGSSSKIRTNRKRRHSDGLYEYQEVVKILEAFLKRCEEQFNLLCGHLGQQTAVDKASAEKRKNLNEELMKLPNLSLQERLRAATRIICDPPKLDLFYSLTGDDRREWVSMLLAGIL
ncbi:hypothetical protein POM88_032790 [Heracleum sosnowskyi]|uniref:Myb/SANT-like domain-containing protein n=1 Tax=Heracleum sosnowskyi TaxID=360622 RepID=A0AAD8HZZ5_9APIA|nr:hypothetical protein POM88_032790 [Heracleum sosnowskyi]